jgi:hypothetical protein
MNRNVKIALGVVAVLGGGYLIYKYFFAPVTTQESAGEGTDEELIYDKATRNVEIVSE